MVPDRLCASIPFMLFSPMADRRLIRGDPIFANLGVMRGCRFDGVVFAGNPFLALVLLAALPRGYRAVVVGSLGGAYWPFDLLDDPAFRELFKGRNCSSREIIDGLALAVTEKVMDRDVVGLSSRFGVVGCSTEAGGIVATVKPLRGLPAVPGSPLSLRSAAIRIEAVQALSKALSASRGIKGSDSLRIIRGEGFRPAFLFANDAFCTSPTENIASSGAVRMVSGVIGADDERSQIQCAFHDVSQVLDWVNELRR